MNRKNIMIPLEVYSRVVGYFRPVNQWNKGKQEEFYERTVYSLNTSMNDISSQDEYSRTH